MRTQILTAAVALSVGAAGAWFLAPRRVEVRTEYKTITVKQTTKTRVRTTKKPDGTVINDQTVTQTGTQTASNGSSATISTPHPRWNVSLLGGMGLHLNPSGAFQPLGGLHATYRVIGPWTVGAWGLGGPAGVAAGLSLGVTF